MKKLVLFLLFAAVVSSACSIYRINSEEVTEAYFPPKQSADDVAYLETVARPYDIIGFVTVNTERSQHMNEIIKKMKKEAAVLGGDAITNITENASGSWKKVPAQKILSNAYVRANFTATVIAFKE